MTDYRQTLELLICEAVRTLRNLPVGQTRPMQLRSGMPEVVREQIEAYGYDKVAMPRFTPSADQIDRLDALLVWMFEAPFENPQEARYLLWGRGTRLGWKVMAQHLGVSRETARKRHEQALLTLAVFIWCAKKAA